MISTSINYKKFFLEFMICLSQTNRLVLESNKNFILNSNTLCKSINAYKRKQWAKYIC